MGNKLAFQPMDAVITVGTNTAGSFPVAIQLVDGGGNDMQVSGKVFCYLAKDSAGATICVDATDTTSMAGGTDGLMVEAAGFATAVSGNFVSETDGDIDITAIVLTTKTAYLVVVLPNGRLVISSIMTYTA